MLVYAVDRPQVAPFPMPDRFRTDIAYFMAVPGEAGVPALQAGEYFVHLADARRWLDEGVLFLVSPLDGQHKTEVEISEEQEDWLEWLVHHEIEHIRLG